MNATSPVAAASLGGLSAYRPAAASSHRDTFSSHISGNLNSTGIPEHYDVFATDSSFATVPLLELGSELVARGVSSLSSSVCCTAESVCVSGMVIPGNLVFADLKIRTRCGLRSAGVMDRPGKACQISNEATASATETGFVFVHRFGVDTLIAAGNTEFLSKVDSMHPVKGANAFAMASCRGNSQNMTLFDSSTGSAVARYCPTSRVIDSHATESSFVSLLAGIDGRITLWDCRGPMPVLLPGDESNHDRLVGAVETSGNRLVRCFNNGFVDFWDMRFVSSEHNPMANAFQLDKAIVRKRALAITTSDDVFDPAFNGFCVSGDEGILFTESQLDKQLGLLKQPDDGDAPGIGYVTTRTCGARAAAVFRESVLTLV